MWFVILTIVTIVYSFYSAFQDLKERMMYCVPCYLLSTLWGIYLWNSEIYQMPFLVIFWLIHVVVYGVMSCLRIWGGGDSDFIILFANVYLATIGNESIYMIAIFECVSICVALFLSVIIGWIEGKVKGYSVNLQSKVAVIPGMSIVVIGFIVKELNVRWFM